MKGEIEGSIGSRSFNRKAGSGNRRPVLIACVEFGRLGCTCIICDRSSCLLAQALAVEPKRQVSLPHLVSGVVPVCGVAPYYGR